MVKCIAELAKRDSAEWLRQHYDELAHNLPDGHCATISDAGHDVHLDAPEQLADRVRAVLR